MSHKQIAVVSVLVVAAAVSIGGYLIGAKYVQAKATQLDDGTVGFGGSVVKVETCQCKENEGGFLITLVGEHGGKFIFVPGKTKLMKMGQMKVSYKVMGSATKGGKCGFDIAGKCVGESADGVMKDVANSE